MWVLACRGRSGYGYNEEVGSCLERRAEILLFRGQDKPYPLRERLLSRSSGMQSRSSGM